MNRITETSFLIYVLRAPMEKLLSVHVAHILRHTGCGCSAFHRESIAANYQHSISWSSEKDIVLLRPMNTTGVSEIKPDIAVITAIDADHLDIYGTEKAMQDAFIEFSQN